EQLLIGVVRDAHTRCVREYRLERLDRGVVVLPDGSRHELLCQPDSIRRLVGRLKQASEIVALQAPESTGVVRDEVADAYILAGCVRPLGNVHGRAVIDVEVALCSSDPDQRTGN